MLLSQCKSKLKSKSIYPAVLVPSALNFNFEVLNVTSDKNYCVYILVAALCLRLPRARSLFNEVSVCVGEGGRRGRGRVCGVRCAARVSSLPPSLPGGGAGGRGLERGQGGHRGPRILASSPRDYAFPKGPSEALFVFLLRRAVRVAYNYVVKCSRPWFASSQRNRFLDSMVAL